jgi:hypothetical protein
MRKLFGLFRDSSGDFWPRVPDVHGTKAASEIDVEVAVNIFNDGSVGLGRKDIHNRTDALGYKLLAQS